MEAPKDSRVQSTTFSTGVTPRFAGGFQRDNWISFGRHSKGGAADAVCVCPVSFV